MSTERWLIWVIEEKRDHYSTRFRSSGLLYGVLPAALPKGFSISSTLAGGDQYNISRFQFLITAKRRRPTV